MTINILLKRITVLVFFGANLVQQTSGMIKKTAKSRFPDIALRSPRAVPKNGKQTKKQEIELPKIYNYFNRTNIRKAILDPHTNQETKVLLLKYLIETGELEPERERWIRYLNSIVF